MMSPHAQRLFLTRGKCELEIYNARKALWIAKEHTSQGAENSLAKEDGKNSSIFQDKTKPEMYKCLTLFLF